MMRQKVIILIFIVTQICFSQTEFVTTPSVIASGGDVWIQNNYNLSFTIGEIAIETFNEYGDPILTQGFQQDNYEFNIIAELIDSPSTVVFPNPTKDVLNILFHKPGINGDLYIKDLNGRSIYSKLNFSTNTSQSINLSSFSQGVYFLEIVLKSNNKIIYQIQKIN